MQAGDWDPETYVTTILALVLRRKEEKRPRADIWYGPFAHHREEDRGREQRESDPPVDHWAILQRNVENHWHEHGLPCRASRASQRMKGVMAKAATGSAQPIPNKVCVANPTSAMHSRAIRQTIRALEVIMPIGWLHEYVSLIRIHNELRHLGSIGRDWCRSMVFACGMESRTALEKQTSLPD